MEVFLIIEINILFIFWSVCLLFIEFDILIVVNFDLSGIVLDLGLLLIELNVLFVFILIDILEVLNVIGISIEFGLSGAALNLDLLLIKLDIIVFESDDDESS